MKFKYPFMILLLVPIAWAAIYQSHLVYSDTVYGDQSLEHSLVPLRFEFIRIPTSPKAVEANAVGRISIDFAQVYFPARFDRFEARAYTWNSSDPERRPSRYAPFLHSIMSFSLAHFDYGVASLLHLLVQFLIFTVMLVWLSLRLGLSKEWFPMLSLTVFLVFLTPVGMSFLERGQFSLYVALAYLLAIVGMVTQSRSLVIASVVASCMKLTSWPFLAILWVVYGACSVASLKFKSKWLPEILLAAFTVLILFSLPFTAFWPYVSGLLQQEMNSKGHGLSLVKVLPRFWVKSLPFLLMLLSIFALKKQQFKLVGMIPYLVGCAILMGVYPTMAFDYSIPCLIGVLPPLVYWSKKHPVIGRCLLAIFIGFLLTASWYKELLSLCGFRMKAQWFYLVGSLPFISCSFFVTPFLEPEQREGAKPPSRTNLST